MHILRSERLGVIWLGVAFLACLGVELWGILHPVEVEPLRADDLLFALGEMPGYASPSGGRGEYESWDAGVSPTPTPVFPDVQGEVFVHELDSSGWVELGLSPRQARGAVRYAEALGGIRNQKQLERMRSLPQGWWEHHAAHLRFPAPQPVSRKHRGETADDPTPEKELRVVDINRADSLELMTIRGVGPWVAGQILRARRQWGGIADLGLLSPALNGWDSLAQALRPSFSCRKEDVGMRCPDTLSVEDWKSLPLIGYKEARLMEKVARHHPGNTDALLRHPVLDSAQQRVLTLYVTPCQGAGWD